MNIQRDRFTTFFHILNVLKRQSSNIAVHRLVSVQKGAEGTFSAEVTRKVIVVQHITVNDRINKTFRNKSFILESKTFKRIKYDFIAASLLSGIFIW